MGGWLLFPFLQRIGAQDAQALRPEAMAVYGQWATGTKYLINPNKAVSASS